MNDDGIADETWAQKLFRRALEAAPAAGTIAKPQREGHATRRVEHSLGVSEVPCQPQRVLCLQGRIDLEACLALGLPIVAAVTDDLDAAIPPHLRGLVDAGRLVGPVRTPAEALDLARTAGADLILGTAATLGACGADLAALAPIMPLCPTEPWQVVAARLADAVDSAPAILCAAITRYDGRLAALRASRRVAIETASVAELTLVGDATGDAPSSGASSIRQLIADLGGVLVAERDEGRCGCASLAAALAQADLIVVTFTAGTTKQNLLALPFWSALPAVRAGRVMVSPSELTHGGLATALAAADVVDAAYALLERSG